MSKPEADFYFVPYINDYRELDMFVYSKDELNAEELKDIKKENSVYNFKTVITGFKEGEQFNYDIDHLIKSVEEQQNETNEA